MLTGVFINIFLKSVKEFAGGLSSKQHMQQVSAHLLQGPEHTITQFKN